MVVLCLSTEHFQENHYTTYAMNNIEMYETCYYIFNSLNWDDLENELGKNLVKE